MPETGHSDGAVKGIEALLRHQMFFYGDDGFATMARESNP
jgi:hypothetical protein